MKTIRHRRHVPPAGYSLLVTLVLTGVATVILAATLQRTMTTSKMNDRTDQYMVATAAAEAATEKVMSRMAVDFANGGEASLSNNLSYYQNSMLPAANTNESLFWANFQFSDGQGNVGRTYVARLTTTPNAPYVSLLQQYPGLSAFASTYRVLSNVKYTNSPYDFTAAVAQDLQMAEIPVFQFAIFYNSLLEFSDCAPLTVNGRVHCNTNIYVGTISGSSLTFNYFVTASGSITNPAWDGFAQSAWTAPITYNGTPSPGYGTGETRLTLPIGTNNTPAAVLQIIQPPPAGESAANPVSAQRYFNKADMLITVTNPVVVAGTNTPINATNYSVWISLKNSVYDGTPSNIFLGTNIFAGTNVVNWSNSGVNLWLSTNASFYDQRENKMTRTTQIDIGQLGAWMATNIYCSNKWNPGNPFNGVIYVQDLRTPNTMLDSIRLVNGQSITNGTSSSALATGMWQSGLTVATPNPLYLKGNYNCPNPAWLQSTNTTLSRPCSVVCDALTILSGNWDDTKAANSSSTPGSRNAGSDTTVNAAIIAGNVASTDASTAGYSGGVHNLTRLLENWSGHNLWLNTSIINLYQSVQATAQFKNPPTYYSPPSRHFLFDLNFTTSTGLPPGTPCVDQMIRASWCNPQPNNVAFTNPPQLFVPH